MTGPLCVSTSTAVARVIDLLLDKKFGMVVVVKSVDLYSNPYRSSSRPLGVFSLDQLYRLTSTSKSLSSGRDLTSEEA